MIKLTLCEEGADKDGGRKRVKGLNCLPHMTRTRFHAQISQPKCNCGRLGLSLCDVVLVLQGHTAILSYYS